MSALPAWQMRDRYDRRVRRARLSLPAHAPACHLAFTIEEALRLTSLPGENEGRCYYFRHLRVRGLPANGERQSWLTSFQSALEYQARRAVHGGAPRAAASDAVYFCGEHEALGILFHRVLAHRTAHEWFWPMVMPRAENAPAGRATAFTSNAAAVLEIIEELRTHTASWIAVAAALFSVPEFDVVHLCRLVPAHTVNAWVAEMDGAAGLSTPRVFRIPPSARPAVIKSMRTFGLSSAHTLWLATLAILLDSPAELAIGTAVARARAALRQFALEAEKSRPDLAASADADHFILPAAELDSRSAPPPLPASAATIKWVDGVAYPVAEDTATVSTCAKGDSDASVRVSSASSEIAEGLICISRPQSAPPNVEPLDTKPATMAPAAFPPARASIRWYCQGLPTRAAGLFFLLHALQRLGMEQALATGLADADPDFVPRLLLTLASHARIPQDDPIALWLRSLVTELPAEAGVLRCNSFCWPANFQMQRDTASVAYVHRVWSVGVRRWCWRAARTSVREIVSRTGVFSVTRTDLDVSLPLEEADVRVRKAGLDLDPGWLPWFGRVVRFHYLFHEEFHV